MRILVTGGAGYIGSHVVKQLLRAGHQPVVFDNLSVGTLDNVITGAEFIEGDILSPTQVLAALEGIEAVIHLAALKAVGESMTHPAKYAWNNLVGSITLLNAMIEAGVKKIIFSSSAAVYGEPIELPMKEDHPTKPLSFYGHTKLEVEKLLAWYDQLSGIKFVVFRYFNAVGYDPDGDIKGLERAPQNLLPIIFEAVMGWRDKVTIFGDNYPTADGTGVRDYIHVSDLASGHLKALEYLDKNNNSLTVNLATGQGTSVAEIIKAVKQESGVDFKVEIGPPRPGDPAQIFASADKARAVLGWQPVFSDLATIVKTTFRAYEQNKKN
ncbi:MAG TPA: UDP-glucose 4-epimerase GalE [bacterium]|nr:UDP-glucose 4-epimerase GalE [bacterium]